MAGLGASPKTLNAGIIQSVTARVFFLLSLFTLGLLATPPGSGADEPIPQQKHLYELLAAGNQEEIDKQLDLFAGLENGIFHSPEVLSSSLLLAGSYQPVKNIFALAQYLITHETQLRHLAVQNGDFATALDRMFAHPSVLATPPDTEQAQFWNQARELRNRLQEDSLRASPTESEYARRLDAVLSRPHQNPIGNEAMLTDILTSQGQLDFQKRFTASPRRLGGLILLSIGNRHEKIQDFFAVVAVLKKFPDEPKDKMPTRKEESDTFGELQHLRKGLNKREGSQFETQFQTTETFLRSQPAIEPKTPSSIRSFLMQCYLALRPTR